MCFTGKSMQCTMKDNMVNGLFFCTTLTSCRRGHTSVVWTGAETTGEGGSSLLLVGPFQGGWCHCQCRGWKSGISSCSPTTPHSLGDPLRALHFCCYRQMDCWVIMRCLQMGVGILDAVNFHSTDRWALSGAVVQDPCHGVLDRVCSIAT